MKNMKLYKTTCLALCLASSLTLSACGNNDDNTISISGSSIVEVIGDNNKVNINGNNKDTSAKIDNGQKNEVTVNGVTITEDNDKLNIQVEGENISINASEHVIDNIEVEIKNNEEDDGSLVFIRNIYEYKLDDGDVEYGIILDIPEDKKSRSTIVYAYTYKIKDDNKAIYSIYEIDKDGNAELLLTQIIDRSKRLRLNP